MVTNQEIEKLRKMGFEYLVELIKFLRSNKTYTVKEFRVLAAKTEIMKILKKWGLEKFGDPAQDRTALDDLEKLLDTIIEKINEKVVSLSDLGELQQALKSTHFALEMNKTIVDSLKSGWVVSSATNDKDPNST